MVYSKFSYCQLVLHYGSLPPVQPSLVPVLCVGTPPFFPATHVGFVWEGGGFPSPNPNCCIVLLFNLACFDSLFVDIFHGVEFLHEFEETMPVCPVWGTHHRTLASTTAFVMP